MPARRLRSSSSSVSRSGAAKAMTPCGASLRAVGLEALAVDLLHGHAHAAGDVDDVADDLVVVEVGGHPHLAHLALAGEQQLAHGLTALDLLAAERLLRLAAPRRARRSCRCGRRRATAYCRDDVRRCPHRCRRGRWSPAGAGGAARLGGGGPRPFGRRCRAAPWMPRRRDRRAPPVGRPPSDDASAAITLPSSLLLVHVAASAMITATAQQAMPSLAAERAEPLGAPALDGHRARRRRRSAAAASRHGAAPASAARTPPSSRRCRPANQRRAPASATCREQLDASRRPATAGRCRGSARRCRRARRRRAARRPRRGRRRRRRCGRRRPRSPANVDAAEHQRPRRVVAEAVDVEALADADRRLIGRRPPPARAPTRGRRRR